MEYHLKAIDEDDSEDESENNDSSSSDEELEASPTKCKKGRILKAFVDSDDEIDPTEQPSKNEANNKALTVSEAPSPTDVLEPQNVIESENFYSFVSQVDVGETQPEKFSAPPNLESEPYDLYASQQDCRKSDSYRESQPCKYFFCVLLCLNSISFLFS